MTTQYTDEIITIAILRSQIAIMCDAMMPKFPVLMQTALISSEKHTSIYALTEIRDGVKKVLDLALRA